MQIQTEDPRIGVAVHWVVKEQESGVWVAKKKFKNLLTTYGLTAFASAPSGVYTFPVYLVIEQTSTTLSATYSAGVTTIQTAGDPTLPGDTQLVLGTGLAGQETVTFSSKSGTGPTTFVLTGPTSNPHNLGDLVVRAPSTGDTMASVVSEAQYDSVNAPNQRVLQTSNYSPASGQNIMQFFISGVTATNVMFAHIGLADSLTVGTGNLHNYAALGYDHTNTNDVEIDVTWTVVGM